MHTSDGRDIIKVHSAVPITEPFATLLVEINWARGHVAHEYTVLLDPPVYTPDQGQAAPPVAAPAVGTSARGGAIQREAAAPPPATTTAPAAPAAPTASPGAASSGQTYQVQRGDTLSRIAAHEAATTSGPEVRRWMVATYQANLDSFDKNMNLLRAGAVLRLPDAAALGAVSAGDAAAEVRRQNVAWHSNAAAGTSEPGSAPGQRHRPPASGDSGHRGRDGGHCCSRNRRPRLQSKVQQLQTQLDESQRLLSIRNADLAKLQLQLAAAQSAAKPGAAAAPPEPAPAPAPVAATSAPAVSPPAETAPAVASTPEQGSAGRCGTGLRTRSRRDLRASRQNTARISSRSPLKKATARS